MFVTLSYRRGQAVLEHNFIPTSRHFACGGVPTGVRPQLWRLILGLPPLRPPNQSSIGSGNNKQTSSSKSAMTYEGTERTNSGNGIGEGDNNGINCGIKRPRTAGGRRSNSNSGGIAIFEDDILVSMIDSNESIDQVELNEKQEYDSLLARVESLDLVTDKLFELDIENVADEYVLCLFLACL